MHITAGWMDAYNSRMHRWIDMHITAGYIGGRMHRWMNVHITADIGGCAYDNRGCAYNSKIHRRKDKGDCIAAGFIGRGDVHIAAGYIGGGIKEVHRAARGT